MWLDYVADAEGVDVYFEAAREGARCLLAAEFGERVAGGDGERCSRFLGGSGGREGSRVFGIAVVVFGQGE